ncbi:MAG: DUF6544 family protein [Gemmatimonadales bacterium]
MRWLFTAFFIVHGIAHLPGFTTPWRITTAAEMPYQTTILAGLIDLGPAGIRVLGVVWLLVGPGMVATGVAVARSAPDWPGPALALIAASLVLSVLGWPAARIGVAVNLALALLVGLGRRGGWLPNAGALDLTLDALWDAAPASPGRFDPATLANLPEPARRYLGHAIAPGTPLATGVRLTMHGEIKLGARWRRFTAEQVIVRDRGMIWRARVPLMGLAIVGSDRVLDGIGAMRWRIAGLIPVMSATGPDVARSAAGRLAGEAIWLPTWLLDPSVEWRADGPAQPGYRLTTTGEKVAMSLTITGDGRVTGGRFSRWGNPDGGAFGYREFGIVADQERSFGGYTIPTRLRAGWHPGTPRFDSEGEFFRMTIERAVFGP